jgi:hypothetical protein
MEKEIRESAAKLVLVSSVLAPEFRLSSRAVRTDFTD